MELALYISEEVVDDKHPQQGDGEPIASLGGRVEIGNNGIHEVGRHHSTEQEEEAGGGNNLHLQLLDEQLSEIVDIPHLCGLVSQESTDEEEQRHTEQ